MKMRVNRFNRWTGRFTRNKQIGTEWRIYSLQLLKRTVVVHKSTALQIKRYKIETGISITALLRLFLLPVGSLRSYPFTHSFLGWFLAFIGIHRVE